MKKGVHITVEETVVNEFKKKTNNFSQWVEDKMREELGVSEHRFLMSPFQDKLYKFWNDILVHYSPARVGGEELKKKIGEYYGYDKRTIDKYFKALMEYDYIRQSKHGYIFEIKREYGWIAQELYTEKELNDEINGILGAKVVKNGNENTI